MDLTGKPFYLDADGVRWVRQTLDGMDAEERIRQLFCLITYDDDEGFCRRLAEEIRPGGFMSRVMPAKQCRAAAERIQKHSRIPMLVAANLEAGGNGVIREGSAIGKPLALAATGDPETARRLGEVCGREGRAVGINWAFAPVADLDLNWRNPITNTRTFGSDPELVRKMTEAYIRGIEEQGVAACVKHFPGDGCDERDQHIAPSVNSLSCGEWDRTYGSIYRSAIDAGVRTVMVGHILQPAYTRYFEPDTTDGELLPATVNRSLVTGLLRGKLGFEGLIVTDSGTMAGLSAALPREKILPQAIAAGCDMFLFTKNYEEDLAFMRAGYESGVFSPERLEEAVLRILALKASLGLHKKQREGRLLPTEAEADAEIGNPLFASWGRDCAARAITLVKEEAGILPLTPERYPRILFYPLQTPVRGTSIFPEEDSANRRFLQALREAGFRVTEFSPQGGFEGMMTPTSEVTQNYDLILYSASLQTRSNQTTVRIEWENPMGINVPVYPHTIPTVFVSFENPYHLVDVPQIRTYINCYCGYGFYVEALMNKLMGKEPFLGKSPSDPFCGKWETRDLFSAPRTPSPDKITLP